MKLFIVERKSISFKRWDIVNSFDTVIDALKHYDIMIGLSQTKIYNDVYRVIKLQVICSNETKA